MFALFHYVRYEGSDFLGVFSTLEGACDAAHAYEAGVTGEIEDGEAVEFLGRLEVYECELDQPFTCGLFEEPVWIGP